MSRAQHIVGSFCGLLSVIYLLDSRGSLPSGISERFQSFQFAYGSRNERYESLGGERRHKLAVVIPYRDAFQELIQLVPSLHQFLNNQRVDHRFVVVHQTDDFHFNKGSLVNIGFLLSRRDCDYLAIHDVDLVPLNSDLRYSYPQKGPYHVAAPEYHPFYHGKTYIGGIILLTDGQFEKAKGMTNTIWGWGGEDNEFYMRIMAQNMTIYRPAGLKTGETNTFKNLHDETKRPRDKARFKVERENVFKVEPYTGYQNVEYTLDSTTELLISGVPVTMHNVKLACDVSKNKWCSP